MECSELQRLRNVIAANRDFIATNNRNKDNYVAGMKRSGKAPAAKALAEFNRQHSRYLANISYLEGRIKELSRDAV